MHNRMTSRRRPAAKGQAPRAPHERDESADSQSPGEPSSRRVGQAALEDEERGVLDTDTGPVLDQAYGKVREGTDDPGKKLSP